MAADAGPTTQERQRGGREGAPANTSPPSGKEKRVPSSSLRSRTRAPGPGEGPPALGEEHSVATLLGAPNVHSADRVACSPTQQHDPHGPGQEPGSPH